jgi:hypothetical protein
MITKTKRAKLTDRAKHDIDTAPDDGIIVESDPGQAKAMEQYIRKKHPHRGLRVVALETFANEIF